MVTKVDFREVVEFTRYEIMRSQNLPIPSDFDKLSNAEKAEVYDRLWDIYQTARTYMTAALNMFELQTQYE